MDPESSNINGPNKKTTHGFTKKTSLLNLEVSETDISSAKIYLNTLAQHVDYRAGSYAMTSLKRMTGTDNFLKLPDDQKKCQFETFEECTAKAFKKDVESQCGCVPWALSSSLNLEVRYHAD